MTPPDPSRTEAVGALLDALPLGCVLLEPLGEDFVWRFVNRAAEALLGPREARLGQRLSESGPAFLERLREAWPHVAAGEALRFEQATEDGRWFRVQATRHEGRLLAVFEDISAYKQLERHIRRMAFQDELTGIYNRRYFAARAPGLLALARRHGWPVALLYLDLNGFKAVNDTFGHRQGDKVLQAVAGRLRSVSRESDIFFRSSGDEFALFLPEASEAAALRAAERIAERLDAPLQVGEEAHRIGASIGVAVMDSATASLDDLLDRSDAAMYAAKKRKGLERHPVALWTPELASA